VNNTMEKSGVKSMLQSTIATVVFEKGDGTLRTMRCTLLPDHLPAPKELAEDAPARRDNPDVLAVWDLDNGGWRSFRLDSIKSITVKPMEHKNVG
jgi:hypothetical protein